MFCSTMSNYKGCFAVNLPGRSPVVADTERTVGTEDGSVRQSSVEDGDAPMMKYILTYTYILMRYFD